MKQIFSIISFSLILMTSAVATAEPQSSTTTDPTSLLFHAKEAMGFSRVDGFVVHSKWISAEEHPYEADRTYPPYFSMMTQGESWFDPTTGVNRDSRQIMYPGGGPTPPSITLSDSTIQFGLRDKAKPTASAPGYERNLNAWLVIIDWANHKGVRYDGREMFRDYPRAVLSRTTPTGVQRLFLDPKTGYPVKLELEEPHYLWGQRKIQYVYSNWQQSGPIFTANSAFRIVDGEVEVSITTGDVDLVARTTSPSLDMPTAASPLPESLPSFLRPTQPTVIDVSPTTRILSNPGYNETVAVFGDEVYVFDATQGEQRAKFDQAIIRSLFPSVKKFNVVVTDLAWPHVAGLRYWVSQGATIISHKAARPFLQQVLNRHWTRTPDSFEKMRKTARFHFVGINAPTTLVGGKLTIAPIDGIGSEVALVGYVRDERFLWASDYIQTLSVPTMYAAEVIQAVHRSGLQPERVAAEHLKMTEWKNVLNAQVVAAPQ